MLHTAVCKMCHSVKETQKCAALTIGDESHGRHVLSQHLLQDTLKKCEERNLLKSMFVLIQPKTFPSSMQLTFILLEMTWKIRPTNSCDELLVNPIRNNFNPSILLPLAVIKGIRTKRAYKYTVLLFG